MRRIIGLALGLMLCAPPALADETLAVPLLGQEMDQWCWDASSLMVLQWYGHVGTTQTEVATWAVGGQNIPNSLDANGVVTNVAGVGNVTTYGCKQVLKQFGPVQSSFLDRALTEPEVETEMDNDRPAILGVFWRKKVGAQTQTVGGHAIVLSGKAGSMVTLNDPWPANNAPGAGNPGVKYVVAYSALFNAPAQGTYNGSANLGNTWGQTLKTGRPIDLCFLIDSTGSMWDDIAAVKSIANDLVMQLAADFKDMRVAVVDYKDYPESPWGSPGDYISNVRLAFAGYGSEADAVNAINAISASGGNDWPEAVYSAVQRTLSGSEVGAWREEAERYVILMGDAPGHNPEPWADGTSYAGLLSYVNAMEFPVSVYALGIGGDTAALADFAGIAGATGGGLYAVLGAGDVADAIEGMVEDFTEDPRAPSGEVAAFTPLFGFDPPVETMLSPPNKVFLVIESYNADKDKWSTFKKVKLPGPDSSSYRPDKPMPIQTYRWQLEYVRKNGVFTLPSGESEKVKGGRFAEEAWTEFDRVMVVPQDPTLLSPNPFFNGTKGKLTFEVGPAANCDKYAVEIFVEGKDKPVKRFTLKPGKKDSPSDTLTKTLGGFKAGALYHWRVQGLNWDRRKPVDEGWSTTAGATLMQSPDGTRSNVGHSPGVIDQH